MSCNDEYMRRALQLAACGEGRTRPNPPVGALVVKDDVVVGEGFHPRAGEPHAEIFALRQAGDRSAGADLFVTLEPCCHQGKTGPCCEAVIAAGIRRVFVGTVDPNPLVAGKGIRRLQEAGVEVEVGLLEKECRRLLAPFAKHVTTGRPFVILKSAVTLDGKTATSTGDSQWISNEQSRQYVHRMRDRFDAIMVGIGTILHDDPRLTTRLPEGGRDPVRVVVDSQLRIPPNAAILHVDSTAPTLVATTSAAPALKVEELRASWVEVLVLPGNSQQVDLNQLMEELGKRNLQSVLVEGGATLNESLLLEGLIDRVAVFIAPKLIGGNQGKGMFAGTGISRLSDAFRLTDVRWQAFGDDLLVEGEVQGCSPD